MYVYLEKMRSDSVKPSLGLLVAFCISTIVGKNVVEANSFSELWKKHGGEVLGTDAETLKSDRQKRKKSKFSTQD